MKIVTCVAPINMAVIKYCKCPWLIFYILTRCEIFFHCFLGGKRDDDLILPINDSLSASLNTHVMCAKTTIMSSPNLKENKFWLNGKEQTFNSPRLNSCLKAIKDRCDQSLPHLNWSISICSENNFPTAAGLASSAAGYACLVYALAKLYGIEGEISDIARQGSGSACRSIYGGWVQWHKGSSPLGLDSIAQQLFPANHWPEMRILILVVNDTRKKYSSTIAMKRSVDTSTLIHHRANRVVPERIQTLSRAIAEKDFATFAEIAMKDSNQLHAICLDTFPPCVYMNDVSHAIVSVVHAFNEYKNDIKAAYTCDAGSNVCIYLLESEVQDLVSWINYVFPKSADITQQEYYRGLPLEQRNMDKAVFEGLNITPFDVDLLKYIIHTNVGDGPEVLKDEQAHLLDDNGCPKSLHF
ncbi:hypothetical protein ABEB36_001815 [Hypothenemus hampei]|uniref:Diphosphomevalonate decarboxylase n=1 Tax=Hypothenemus hampei TaxID=57062 RepID=A0ABD1FFT7_HYPHA